MELSDKDHKRLSDLLQRGGVAEIRSRASAGAAAVNSINISPTEILLLAGTTPHQKSQRDFLDYVVIALRIIYAIAAIIVCVPAIVWIVYILVGLEPVNSASQTPWFQHFTVWAGGLFFGGGLLFMGIMWCVDQVAPVLYWRVVAWWDWGSKS